MYYKIAVFVKTINNFHNPGSTIDNKEVLIIEGCYTIDRAVASKIRDLMCEIQSLSIIRTFLLSRQFLLRLL